MGFAVEVDLPGVRAFQAGQNPQSRRFPTAGGADEHRELAGGEVQVDRRQDAYAAEALLDLLEPDVRQLDLPCGRCSVTDQPVNGRGRPLVRPHGDSATQNRGRFGQAENCFCSIGAAGPMSPCRSLARPSPMTYGRAWAMLPQTHYRRAAIGREPSSPTPGPAPDERSARRGGADRCNAELAFRIANDRGHAMKTRTGRPVDLVRARRAARPHHIHAARTHGGCCSTSSTARQSSRPTRTIIRAA